MADVIYTKYVWQRNPRWRFWRPRYEQVSTVVSAPLLRIETDLGGREWYVVADPDERNSEDSLDPRQVIGVSASIASVPHIQTAFYRYRA